MIGRTVLLAALLAATSGCPGTGEPATGEHVALLVRARVHSSAVVTLTIEVTGAGIPAPLVFNLAVTDGEAQGTVEVPSGARRTFTFHAFDGGGVETHSGSVTVDVQPGTNPTVSVVLEPLAGDVPIDVELGSIIIEVVPRADTLEIDQTAILTARVTNAEGSPVRGPVRWATLAPGVATVTASSDSTGAVTAIGAGETQIVATLGGVAGAATIVVSPRAALVEIASGLTSPLYVTAPPGDTIRLFIVEQSGRVRVWRGGALLPAPFLDIQSLVTFSGEQGLLGLAFHPDYATNGFVYVDYTDTGGDTRVVRYRVSADPDVADAASALEILFVDQPFANHNGGLVAFGPDGLLYVGLGDGGSGGDPQGHGQDSTTLLGSLLRIDVDGGSPYAIPASNPFAGHGSARQEIWAYGLRNPWRFSFDRATGDLVIADVGQSAREEVNFQPGTSARGENYGWNTMEGSLCFDPPTGCDQAGLTLPVHDYGRADGCAVTGGYVYRGRALPALVGRYFYSDFCGGWIKSFRVVGGEAVDHRDHTSELGGSPGNVTSFGEDARGELYVVTQGGRVLRLGPRS